MKNSNVKYFIEKKRKLKAQIKNCLFKDCLIDAHSGGQGGLMYPLKGLPKNES